MRLRFNILDREFLFVLEWRNKRKKDIVGYTSRTQDGKHIIMMDYDFDKLEWIEDEIKALQEDFKLGNAYIFKSNKGYHVVIPDKVAYGELITILKNSSVDPNHYYVPKMYGTQLITLRVSEKDGKKPQFIKEIKSKYNNNRKKSKAHIIFLNKIFNLNIPLENTDNYTKLIWAKYKI